MRTSTSDAAKLRALIDAEAQRAGFDAVAVTSPDAIPLAPARLAEFVADGFHGSMDWIAETLQRRSEPTALWPQVRSIVVLAMNYGPDHDLREVLAKRDRGAISVYAQNRDYHDVMKGRLKEIAGKLVARAGGDVKVFVDTAPVMEKPLAEAAGLGWQGKHTNLVSREHGSWLFLGTIFTTAELVPDRAEIDHCGSCRACLDACPTDAFPAPYRLDARRCISYLTIENKGPIPHEFREKIGNRIYGCDDCLAACPWNKFARAASEAKLAARDDLREPPLPDLLGLDDAAFRAFFSGSPIKRIGRDRFIRNVLIAAGNSGEASLSGAVLALLGDPSPLVRGAAIWALARLVPNAEYSERAAIGLKTESDEAVRDEWRLARPTRANA
ncbi:tRNA epoxyqueuosine(34) reductase QueG [Mesorhizobium sp. M7A.F.Ca.CA.001.09.2.1]|uniref:Epoxyqueuosine reductase n=6 Tax=Mesorhizobium TaxID=68287 RepID=A0AB38TDR0_9HYPH|nr:MULTISPECIES: tRNA epoxyqueuosine(34) reductase QueG [Mesorhizobium]MDF3213284.1 tRNA epoxyqueuosine(34) reductase QueG [Mesorhizobium ciceri]RUY71542.1 tRNA epoxyqueuosine(34) reductase QueG [Mesorhizobium sp. M7A.F.Ca.CA.001.05.1.1]RUY78487.1 tRNA epoxyqueuosine(34) reductase QueG [Mesorhizobium sp. M7A.F.Ca.CA.001.09.2.1]RUZ08272.1 tRNA epoxyqueuosine(34) reductase QueG [Mesorhizobium sp. M7A.F.Ca.CA.001.04.2.1]RUZ31686.1 tRNA epoxyqueuosine(34) reductase QueG [Mesorhizobium sp. M7A.F.Ca